MDKLIATLDQDGDGVITKQEWLFNLGKCEGLVEALTQSVNANGLVPSFRSFEQQKAKREGEVAALKAKATRTAEEEAELVEYERQIAKLTSLIAEANKNALKLAEWGSTVFHQFDTDHNGKLSKKELNRALKALPKTKPKHVPPGAKFLSVEEMVASLDGDGDGEIDEQEWLDNLAKCAGLAAALAENVDAFGKVASFRTFEEQYEKRKGQVAELEALASRSEEQEKKLAEYRAECDSWAKHFANAGQPAAQAAQAAPAAPEAAAAPVEAPVLRDDVTTTSHAASATTGTAVVYVVITTASE